MAEPYESNDPRNAYGDKDGVHQLGIRRANESWRAEQQNVSDGREDQRFYAGEQWPAQDKIDRDRERRPAIVINRLTQFVRQVTGDIRKDPPATKVLPAKDATKEAAEIRTGLIRNIEQQSNAKAAYVQAVGNACQVGMGVWRILKEYEGDNAFDQVIRIQWVQDPFAALCDPAARMPEKSDADFWFIIDDYSHDKFKAEFPGKSLDDFPSPVAEGFIWRTEQIVRVAEYWYKLPTTKTILQLSDGSVVEAPDKKNDGDIDGMPFPPGVTVINTRKVKTHKVMQVLMSGKELLTEPQEWEGRYIPIVPVIGEEIRFDGRTLRRGMVRDARGPQQVYNYMRTAATEVVAKQPAAPFILTVNQIKGYEDNWANAGSANTAYLVYNVDPQAPTAAPQRSTPPQTPAGLDAQAMIAANDIEAVIGIYKPSLGAQSNETSGRAILARQKEADTGSFHYVDNLRDALVYSGKIILDLIPHVYDAERIIRIIKEDGSTDMVKANQPMPQGVDPKMMEQAQAIDIAHKLNDLTVGEYDIVVSTGPGYQTKRMEASEGMRDFIQAYPPAAPLIGDLYAKGQDWPLSDEIAKRLEAVNPLNQPHQGPPPEVVAKTKLDEAKAEGQQIENIGSGLAVWQLLQQMHLQLQQVQQGVAVMGQPPQLPAPSSPPQGNGAIPPAPNGGMGELEPLHPPQAQLSPAELTMAGEGP